MDTALDVISIAASSLLSSAVVTGIVQILFKEHADARLERLRNELASEKSAREEDGRRISEQLRTQYSWLYVERAKVMNELYGCIIEADEAIRDCLPPLAGWGLAAERASEAGDLAVYQERVRLLMEACERFERKVRKSKLLFSGELAKRLGDLVRAYESITFELDEREGGMPPMAMADSLAVAQGEHKAQEILRQIESEFRLLYGSLADSAIKKGEA
jgi:hypothetical protein